MMIHLQRAHDFVGLLVSLVLSVPKNLQYFQFCSKAKTNDRCMGAYIINSGLCIETVFLNDHRQQLFNNNSNNPNLLDSNELNKLARNREILVTYRCS